MNKIDFFTIVCFSFLLSQNIDLYISLINEGKLKWSKRKSTRIIIKIS